MIARSSWRSLRKKILPRTLYWRSLMIIIVPVLLMQMIVAYVFVDRHWNSMSDKLVFALAGEIALITDQIRDAPSPKAVESLVVRAQRDLSIRITVADPSEGPRPPRRPTSLTWYGLEAKLQRALADKITESFTILPYAKDRRFVVRVTLDDGRVLQFTCYNYRLTGAATYIFLLWLIGSSLVLATVAVLFMRNQVRPILRLAVAAEKLGKGQDVPSFKPEGAREVRQAARAFLDMRDRIRRQIEQRTVMLAGVSHDLRTPLTRMKLQLALLKDAPEAELLRADLTEMEKMLEGYLAFARGEGGEETALTDLRTVLERIAGNFRRQGHAVDETYEGKISARVRPVAIERALANIVGNACAYARHAWITARATDDTLEIRIDDDGPGIPPEKREEVFRPFTRLEKSRNSKTGGVGLGLSIAQDIVHGHGGEITLGDSPHGGLSVLVRLPV